MKTRFMKFMSIAAAAAIMAGMYVPVTYAADEESTDVINYLVNDTFDKKSDGTFDSCGWYRGATSDDTVYGVYSIFSLKPAQPDMAYISMMPGTTTPGQQPNIRKDLESPIDVTKGKVVLEARMAGDTTYGYSVNFELNRPKTVSELSENNMNYNLFSLNSYTKNALTKASVYVKNNAAGQTNYLDGYTAVDGFDRPVLSYGEPVTVQAVIDYNNNHVDYYVTYPTGTYKRTDGVLTPHDLLTTGKINSLAFTVSGNGNASNQVNFWVDYVKIYQIKETGASFKSDKRTDSDIKITFDNAAEFPTIDFSKYVTLKTQSGESVETQNTYSNGTVVMHPQSILSGASVYTVSVDKNALAALGCTYTGTDFTFTTLKDGVYLNDTLTVTDYAGWTASGGAVLGSHWAGDDILCIMPTTTTPGGIEKSFDKPISLTDGKVIIEADVMSDAGASFECYFNINKPSDSDTVRKDALFNFSGNQVGVHTKNGISKAFNPNMSFGDKVDAGGRPSYVFAQPLTVKAVLDYENQTIRYYVTYHEKDGDSNHGTYTRDGWDDNGNLVLSTGLPEQIENISFNVLANPQKFWVENVRIENVKEVSAEVTAASAKSVTLAIDGDSEDLKAYFDLYDAAGNKLNTQKTYNSDTNEITLALNTEMSKGETYSVKVSNVAMIANTGIYYNGDMAIKFVSPTFDGCLISKVFSNRGNGAYAGATVKNNGNEPKKIMIVIAEKDAEGTVVKLNAVTEDIAVGAKSENLYANFLSIDSANTIEAYIWEAETLRPLSNKIIVVNQN